MKKNERKALLLMKTVATVTIFLILLSLLWVSINSQQDTVKIIGITPARNNLIVFPKNERKSMEQILLEQERYTKAFKKEKLNYINYWAQWCVPCKEEIPELKSFAERNPNINLIFVNVDEPSSLKEAQDFWQETSLGLKTYYLKEDTSQVLKYTSGLPYHQIFDLDNKLWMHFGGVIGKFEVDIEKQLAK